MTSENKSRLSKDLDILLNYKREEDASRDLPVTHEELVTISAKVQAGSQIFIERSVCTDDIPADAIGETVAGVLHQIHTAGLDVMKQTVTITFGTVAELDDEGASE